MVNAFAVVVFLVFAVEVTSYASIITLGASKTVIFAALIALSSAVLLLVGRIRIVALGFPLLALAVNELVISALNGEPSINFVRILAATIAATALISREEIYRKTLSIMRISHLVIVFGFLAAVLAVAVLGPGILHAAFPLSDDAVFRKIDYGGGARILSLGFFHFTANAQPPLNILNLNVLPSGVAPEPHAFFSFILVSTLLLMRAQLIGKLVVAASLITLMLSYSTSNGLGLVGGVAVTLLIYLANKFSARRAGLGLMALGAIAAFFYARSGGFLMQDSVQLALANYDRSVAESYGTIVRFFSIGNGGYPLEATPNYFNDFAFLPLSLSSFLLFSIVLLAIFWRVCRIAKQLSYIDIFLLSYGFAYSFKSFGVTIFQPYLLIAILIVLYRTAPAADCMTRPRIAPRPIITLSKTRVATRSARV